MRSEALQHAISRLTFHHPFFAVLVTKLAVIREVDEFPYPAATDGRNIICNKQYFNKFTQDERVFVLAHEALHILLQHLPRMKEYFARGVGPDGTAYNPKVMGYATDYVINSTLVESGVGSMPDIGLIDSRFTSGMSADEVYIELMKNPPPDDEPGGFDEHSMDGEDAPTDAEVKQAAAAAAAAQKVRGSMPGSLQRIVDELIEGKVDWRDQLREFVQRTVGIGERTWKRPFKRRLVMAPGVYTPGRISETMGELAIVIDTSGSISQDELNTFLSEVDSIVKEVSPRRAAIFWTDSKVAGIDDIDDTTNLLDLSPKGGGGTDMEAAFPVIEEHILDCEAIIVLTDGYTSFDRANEPQCPVLWTSTTEGISPPYGRTIYLDIS